MTPLEIWGGIECTINRVGDSYNNQCERTGHWLRPGDFKRVRELGITKLRYPVLWEMIAPEREDELDWTLTDRSLTLIRDNGLQPMAGLLHHGSGPRYTSLLDPEFPKKLASFARKVAERYPWIEWYTPVNEPLTTARFSCLYGNWYPHKRETRWFLQALVNQAKGILLAMLSIREINPQAKLLQTEDIGRILSTPPLQYQADYENHRRWLSYDLLFGRVREEDHPFYAAFRECCPSEDLDWIRENATAPDLIGVNHYLLSNRFLDHRLEFYPMHTHGGNGRDAYADVGAVDTGQVVPPRAADIFREVWERYERPMVISEVHTGGGREAQMRWMKEVAGAVHELRSEGADIRALTAWSLFGNYDWISLCTRCDGHYESGPFDVRSRKPRLTAVGKMIRQMAEGVEPRHPVLERNGYWREPIREIFAPSELNLRRTLPRARNPRQPILITGATGTLGSAFARICERRGLDYVLLGREQMDIASPKDVERAFRIYDPWAAINTAGYVQVDNAEVNRQRCLRENLGGPKNLAKICAKHQRPFLTFSSDLVFDGNRSEPYHESDRVSPLNVYGRSKAESERAVLEIHPGSLVVRTSAFFGPWDEHNFIRKTLNALHAKALLRLPEDVTISPTYVPDLVWACLDLLIDGERGLIHLANKGQISWAEWARVLADRTGADRAQIIGCSSEEIAFAARRPRYSVLESERVDVMPSFEHALQRYLAEAR